MKLVFYTEMLTRTIFTLQVQGIQTTVHGRGQELEFIKLQGKGQVILLSRTYQGLNI